MMLVEKWSSINKKLFQYRNLDDWATTQEKRVPTQPSACSFWNKAKARTPEDAEDTAGSCPSAVGQRACLLPLAQQDSRVCVLC